MPRGLGDLTVPVEYPAGTAVGEISFTTLKLVLKEFEIEQEVAGTSEVSFEFAGPYVVDLIGQTIDPDPGVVDLPGGVYTELKFKIDTIEGDEVDAAGAQLVAGDDPLFGHSILIVGTFTPTSGTPVDFTFTYDLDAEFELKTVGEVAVGFDVTNGTQNSIIVAFRFHRWFDGIDPAAFAADPGAYVETLKTNIEASADYGKDVDDDGILSSAEDDDPDEEDLEDV
jgi:hypothetical protein